MGVTKSQTWLGNSTTATASVYVIPSLLDLKGQRDPGEESFRKRGEIVVKQKLILVGYLKIELPQWLSGKESACRRHRSLWLDPWVGKVPWRRAWQPTPVFLPREFHGQEPGELQSIESQRVGHDWSDLAHTQKAFNASMPYPHNLSLNRLTTGYGTVMGYYTWSKVY